jgi:isopenicillin-N epimerase
MASGSLAAQWSIDPAITFLNHGSFGACPTAVLEAQQAWRARMEANLQRFFARDLEDLLDEARTVLAAFVRADADGLAFVHNATTAVNAVLRSLRFGPDDELLVTDHEYTACRNTLDFVADRAGARVVVAAAPFPLGSAEEALAAVVAGVTPRTRLALVDHVTSPTGLVLPIHRLVAELQGRGVDVLVDGAHAPGMVDLDLTALGAAYYTGNCHKWLCAPKGAAFLHVRADRREQIRPVNISHGASARSPDRARFRLEFDWTGTDDPTAYLSVPAAIRHVGGLLPGGWPEVRRRNRALALEARALLCDALKTAAPSPDDMIGSLAAVPLPDGEPRDASWWKRADPLQRALWERFGIEAPIVAWPAPPRRLVRISAALYNTRADYERLVEALGVLLPG